MKKTTILSIALLTGYSLFSQSEETLRANLKTNPNDAKTANDLAVWVQNERRYPEAVVYFKKAIDLDTANSVYSYNLAYMYQYLVKRTDSAMYYYRVSGRRFTNNNEKYNNNAWKALLGLSGESYDSEYFIEAYENYSRVATPGYYDGEKYKLLKGLSEHPTADGYIQLGEELCKKLQFNEPWDNYMNRYESGSKIYDKAVKLDPTKKEIVNVKLAGGLKEIGNAYFEDGAFETALNKYEQALKYSQKDPELYSAIGIIKLDKLSTPDYKGAITCFQRALALSTATMQKKDYLENIGLCYEKQKDYTNAIVYYDKGIALEPNFAKSLHYKLTRVYEALGNTEKAKYHRLRS